MTSTPTSVPEMPTTALLFGPQALSFDATSLRSLRSALLESEHSEWVSSTLSELPSRWKTLTLKLPQLQGIAGEKLLTDLNTWFQSGTLDRAASQLPNILLTPLVVLTQLIQYTRYLQQNLSTSASSEQVGRDLHAAFLRKRSAATIGFCTGLLSASVISVSETDANIRENGAVAIRLAMLIGAVVDAQDAADRLHGRSKSFSTSWSSTTMAQEMIRIIDCFPEAYISVLYDENRATVTTSEGTVSLLMQQLKQAGVTALEVGLRGRFHSQCHHKDLASVLALCDSDPAFRYTKRGGNALPIFLSGTTHAHESEPPLHHMVVRMILEEQSKWYQTFAHMQSTYLQSKDSIVVSFGPDRAVPPSLMRKLGTRLVHAADLDQTAPILAESVLDPIAASIQQQRDGSSNDIAVVGMSVQVAGASDLEEFWKILCEGKSQHIEVPEERFGFETQWRDVDQKRKWYGNFIKDHDIFDHKFFKRSPREVVSTDPQQRLMLQGAYQAVEQSGYFHEPNVNKKIGCYLGACAADYEANVAGYAANAFTATGNLKSFIAGKISHYFGWTGPSMTLDSACSASAVAIHLACRSILAGECPGGAIAGGVALMGNPIWFQNLAGASFLSPTGQCKPWDDKADGYCRGEAVACVFLKKMSTAIADGNQILGRISSTAVYQNENCTPIFVPNSPSLSGLFKDVVSKAGLEPNQISVVEAHGTGTPVGDPAEYESVRQALGGPTRDRELTLGSVKGLVGHTEGASGVVSLIKSILMIQEASIPPQASFDTMSHHVKASPTDMMRIPTKLSKWDSDFKALLINNYGASGSNASMVVTQPFQTRHDGLSKSTIHSAALKHPVWICGLNDRSLRDYARRVVQLIRTKTISAQNLDTANMSFNLCRQSNRALDRGLIFSCASVEDLEKQLDDFEKGDNSAITSISIKKTAPPTILCFGGQISTHVGLDKGVYDSVQIFRSYLNQCNSVFLSIGLAGIFPEIFQREPIQDTVKLQTMLFATQYACAKTWIDCGVSVDAVVGHSFGELTALCISGVLSLKDTAKMITARAQLIQDSWGADRGSMMAIEADVDVVNKILDEYNSSLADQAPVTIACFNGPRSFTLAGGTKAIDAVADLISRTTAYASTTRSKKLNVTNAFHSTLVEPLMEDLEEIGRKLTFQEPNISLERSTELPYMEDFGPAFVADHMRQPVFFNHAVQRLAKQFPSAVWLEAGSNSSVTMMAARALGYPSEATFQAVNITNSDNGMTNLSDTTLSLWKSGLKTEFWPHHAMQTYEYDHIFLPPYQFEKVKHWMELKKPQKLAIETAIQPKAEAESLPTELWTFVGYQDKGQRVARFRINTMTKKYSEFVSGHLIAQTAPICPATLEVDMAIEALMSIRPEFAAADMHPSLLNMENHAPICIDHSRAVWIDFEAVDAPAHTWNWRIVSTGSQKGNSTEHVNGKLWFRSVDDPQYQLEFARYERLIGHQKCLRVLNAEDADDIIQGRTIYKTFDEVVRYGDDYRGLKRLVGLGNECAGRVVKKYSGTTWLDTHLTDCFSQVGGIWVNCMTSRTSEEMFIASGCEALIRSPKLRNNMPRPESWDVFAYHHQTSEKAYTTDVFTFDASTGVLMEVMLGINYAKVAKASMQKILARLSPDFTTPATVTASMAASTKVSSTPNFQMPERSTSNSAVPPKFKVEKKEKKKRQSLQPDIKSTVRSLLADVSGVEPEDIKDDTELADIGIDSLMGMELAREVELTFKLTLDMENLMEVTNIPTFVACIQAAMPADSSCDETDSVDSADDSEQSSYTGDDVSIAGSDGLSTPPSTVGDVSEIKVNIIEYLADLLGVDAGEIQNDTLVVDLGVDSLLSSELRSDLSGKFDVHLSEEDSIEAMSVEELNLKVNGMPVSRRKSGSAPEQVPTSRQEVKVSQPTQYAPIAHTNGNLQMPASTVLTAFGETKMRTDQMIVDYGFNNFAETICPRSTLLCIALTLDAFEQLGVNIRSAKSGDILPRIQYAPQHDRLVEYLYDLLEKEARLVNLEGGKIVRTGVLPPSKSSKNMLQDLLRIYPDWSYAMKLTSFAGLRLADVLTNKTDGIKVIFGSEQGRELVAGLYCDHVFNKMNYSQMTNIVESIVARLPMTNGPIKIMEMGAGTGGTTLFMVPMLARLGIPVEYTFSDLSPSMVAAARKKFKPYPFMKFMAHDIEKPVPAELLGSQHIVLASNAIHATHDLVKSLKNIHDALRSDGFVMMLEMTEIVPFVDIIFGLLEGWWLFDDGRKHAIAHQDRWERDLQTAGFGHVDYTDGHLPENKIQKVIIGMASEPAQPKLPIPPTPTPAAEVDDLAGREKDILSYVHKFSAGFETPTATKSSVAADNNSKCVLITGATGSLGSHLVKEMAERVDVKTVVCMNRRSSAKDPFERQEQSFRSRGIEISATALSKLHVLETDTHKAQLGLSPTEYNGLVNEVTDILHNAWPMSGKRPIRGFEAQFQTLRNLIDFARDIACNKPQDFQVGFQFISSIGVVGHYPIWSGNTVVPEERMEIKSVLSNGYCDSKFTCERILDATLHKYPDRFRTMSARLGQIAGSKTSGYWNPMEHFSFLVKSSKNLRVLPDFEGVLSWCPVNDMAAALSELLLDANHPYPIYHVDNPVQQPWSKMIRILAKALDIPDKGIVPFPEWVSRVRRSPLSTETDNPAGKLIDFLDDHFLRMSCGGLIMSTKKACEHSKSLAAVGPVSEEVARRYVKAWEDMGFLY